MEKENIEDIEPFTAEDEYVEYQNDMQSQVKKDLEEASALFPFGSISWWRIAKSKSNVCLFIAFSYSNFFSLTEIQVPAALFNGPLVRRPGSRSS